MKLLLSIITLATLVGCAHEEPGVTQVPPFFVPSTALAQARANPYQLLPASDGDVFIPRVEKFAYGTTNSSATIYTYDTQNISIRHSGSSGYRYRWIVEQYGSYDPAP